VRWRWWPVWSGPFLAELGASRREQCVFAIGQLEFRLRDPCHYAVDWHMAPTVVGVVVWFSAIGAVGLLVVVRHVSARRRRPARGNKVIFAIISCVIVCIWGRWWFAQRKHFLWTKEGR
jgi:hypothetical protein